MQGTDTDAMDYGLNRALDAYYNDRAWFHGLQKRVMEQVRWRVGREEGRGQRVWSPHGVAHLGRSGWLRANSGLHDHRPGMNCMCRLAAAC